MSVQNVIEWLKHPNLEWISTMLASLILDRLVRIPRVGGYSERYVLVTGAARGFGYDAVLRLEALGCHVFAGVRTFEAAEQIRSVCSARVDPVILDINSDDEVQAALKYVTSKIPAGRGLWGIVNNAGMIMVHQMEWAELSDYEEALRTNVIGTIRVTTAFLPLIKQALGRVVNVTSIGGRLSCTIFAPYSVSKYGCEAYSDALRRIMRPYGVKVLIIEPGSFKTSMITGADKVIKDAWNRVPKERQQELGQISLDNALKTRKLFEWFSSSRIGDVSEAYVHALLARYPRGRYAVGLDCALIFKPLIYLPEWLSDLLFGIIV